MSTRDESTRDDDAPIDLRTLREAAAILRVSPRTLQVLTQRAALPCVRLSPRRIAYRMSDLRAYVAAQTREPAANARPAGRSKTGRHVAASASLGRRKTSPSSKAGTP